MRYFPDRDCVTLPRPVEDEADLRNLKNIPFENLKSNFKYEYNILKNKVFKESKPKRFRGKAMNGLTLANLITSFIESMNSGVVPNITNTWDSIIKDEINICYENSFSAFKISIKDLYTENNEQEDLIKFSYAEYIKANISLLDVLKKNPDIFYNESFVRYFSDKQKKLKSEFFEILKKLEDHNYEKNKKYYIVYMENLLNICLFINVFYKNQYCLYIYYLNL